MLGRLAMAGADWPSPAVCLIFPAGERAFDAIVLAARDLGAGAGVARRCCAATAGPALAPAGCWLSAAGGEIVGAPEGSARGTRGRGAAATVGVAPPAAFWRAIVAAICTRDSSSRSLMR